MTVATGSPVLDTIVGIATVGGAGAAFAAFRAWAVSHALRALEIEGPRAASTAALAYADAIEAGKSQLAAGDAAIVAAKGYLVTTISGPLAKLKKSDAVIDATATGVAAQAIQAATKLGVPAAMVPVLQPLAGEAAVAGVMLAEGEADKLIDKLRASSPESAAPGR